MNRISTKHRKTQSKSKDVLASFQLSATAEELLYNRVDTDNTEVDALIERVMRLDRKLGSDLECAVSGNRCDAMRDAFVIGWQCARNPEILAFAREE